MQTALTCSNFYLQSGAWVQQIVHNSNTATVVIANVSDVTNAHSLSAKGRVIVRGGALKSPELLMKSAIGAQPCLKDSKKPINLAGSRPQLRSTTPR